ncbi:MAG: NADH:ubiquinone reductase (Na(+)-transporting) subunit F [Bacteroidetes bacterium GWF2_42_66]|nr:MAG: NADH:ubiquinone reductase (Na(+)-transporting) subunit F [Bacteroidetes bacterium GWA2_42_15]OFX99967.1 MAG: NADH:ubiquinone reductase (Na(+)-transporting) subunit F [Bacteroidetes bacterium GWE2_42_39]OFY40152.1 MAG: NADH:ubiquinone reductase (Na(+)-transporting) subunit F [Bacteroidetes bacterium GWF2_42_66]HBL73980.1 NADH:ubiquinone reductase (Na(+)-transporting) subunit F [Prolixibacteraceae bacterium]HCR89209.1 NADH:ubiquinone reductase (Na(+)-transporting) subunit F [Prolixibacter
MILGSIIFVIISSILAFLIIVLALVSTLLFARAKLTAVGDVKININGEKEVIVGPGSSLLSTLSEKGIFLPSACGGGGTCAQCRCQVVEGGGSILATETDHFTRKEQQNHWRLGCQVKVREDMKILVPEHVLGVKKWECEVISNDNVATYIKEFVVKLPEGEMLNFKSGGYIQIDVPKIDVDFKDMDISKEYRPEWERYNMFDLVMKNPEPTFRAYSMANHPAEGNIVMLNIRIATPPFDRVKGGFQKINPGICSSYIFSRKPGDKVTISGPYGEFFLKDNDNEMMFIGGGAGMAPMRSHLLHLFQTVKETKKKITFWYGARSWREVFYYDQFREIEKNFPNFTFSLALSDPLPEDNWTGPKGFIHQVIYDQYLSKHEEPEEIDYYLCGPPMMNSAVQKMLYDLGVPDENVLYDDFGS